MASLIRWDPFGELSSLRRAMDRLFEDFAGTRRLLPAWEGEFTFPMDVYETDEAVVAKAALPGVRPEEVDISVRGDTLTIKGESKHTEEVKGENYHRRELHYGAFARSVVLPVRVDYDRAEAEFENGVLTVTLPKAAESKAKTIKVRPVIEGKK